MRSSEHRGVLMLLAVLVGGSARAEPPFEVARVETSGRTVAAELADVDGDGRSDLLELSFRGIPPDDQRELRLHFQAADGSFPGQARLRLPLPEGVAAFDLADVLPTPGVELLLLRRASVRILDFAGRQPRSLDVALPARSAGVATDERGLSRLPLARRGLGPAPLLLVPGLGEAFLVGFDGLLRGRLDTGERVNFFVQPPGLVYTESDIQFFYDVPRLSVGDVDGDGRSDLLSSGRHELRVFLQGDDGSFPAAPSRRLALGRVSQEDHIRSSGTVRVSAADIDADGRLDLMISSTTGGLGDVRSSTELFFNRGGQWRLDAPDLALEHSRAMVADRLIDADGDGRLELVQARVPLSVLELVEAFLTRSVDAHLALYEAPGPEELRPAVPARPGAASKARQKRKRSPRLSRKLGLPFSFETGRLRGFTPSFAHDLDGDGHLDLLHSGDGGKLVVHGGPGLERRGEQALDSEGVIRPGDLDGDGAIDFVLSNPRRPGAPILLLRNRLPQRGPRAPAGASP